MRKKILVVIAALALAIPAMGAASVTTEPCSFSSKQVRVCAQTVKAKRATVVTRARFNPSTGNWSEFWAVVRNTRTGKRLDVLDVSFYLRADNRIAVRYVNRGPLAPIRVKVFVRYPNR